MDKTDWLILQEIFKEKSISKVADKLFVSQPAISYRLQKMESEFQRSLFIRTTKGVQFTEAGLRLHKYAYRMLLYDAEITSVVQSDPSEYSGRICIGATASFTSYFMCKQLHDFCSIYQNIKIDVALFPSITLFNMFNSGELMVASIRGNRFLTKDQHSYPIFTEPLLIIAREPITMDYLKTHPFIQNSSETHLPIDDLISEWFSHTFDKPPISSPVQISGDSRIMVELVKNGFGWTIISKSRLIDSDSLYYLPIFKPDGSPYRYLTQLFYTHEADHLENYRVYLQHFKKYFTTHYGDALE